MRLLGLHITRTAPAAQRIEPPVMAAVDTSGTTRPAPWLVQAGWGGSAPTTKGLPRVTPEKAAGHGTVFGCCNNIAGDLAKVPLKLWQRGTNGRDERVREHAAPYLLNVEAAPGLPGQIVRFASVYAYALRGNGYAYAPRSGAGELLRFELVRRQDMVQRLSAGLDQFYDFEDAGGVMRRVPSRSMAHLRYLAEDGWSGRSPLQVAAETMGIALAGQRAAARTAGGGTAKAVIKLNENYESDEDRVRNARRVKEQVVSPDADGFPVLGPDEDIKSLDLSAADQELLASRKFDREQIAAIYRMPPSKLQMLEHGVKANGEQQAIDYLTDCLMHWSVLVEAQLSMAVLTRDERERGLFLRHDFGALLQPTIKDQYEALTRAVGGPILTPDEGRAKLGYASTEGGDTLNPAPNMTRKEETEGKE